MSPTMAKEIDRQLEELEAKNELLKRELKQTEAQDKVVIDGLRKENARLRCTALHLFSKHFFDCYWNIEGPNHIRYLHLHEKYDEAYRKAKKALREGK